MTSLEAPQRRLWILEAARSRNEADRREARAWIGEAVTPGTGLWEIYRLLEFDLESDVRDCLPAFRPLGDYHSRLASRALRRLWRRLLGIYAYSAARAVFRDMRYEIREPRGWLLWTWKDRLMPRIAVAVLIGYLLVASNGGLLEILGRARSSAVWTLGICLFSLMSTFCLTLADVQRRVGRNVRRLVRGSVRVTGCAVGWAALGGVAQFWGAKSLGMGVDAAFAVLCAASAMSAAFLAQLFWQDRSLGDPL